MAKQGRNASMELLRVIAMLMIIGHHLVYYSGLTGMDAGWNRYFAQLVNIGGKLGVNLFVLIGGWYMSVKEYRSVRTVRLWLQTVFTGLLMLAVCACVWGVENLGDALAQVLFPVSQSGYWFAGTYIVLTMLMPFLNLLLRAASRRAVDVLLGILTAAMSLIPTLVWGKEMYFSPIGWFVYLYLLAGRLRRWPYVPLARYGMSLFVGNGLVIWGSTLLLGYRDEQLAAMGLNRNYLADRMETIPMLCASLGLFMAFVQKRPRTDQSVEFAGRACLGIYLIHDNPLLRGHLWSEWICAGALANSPWLAVYAVIAVLIVFWAALAAETLRKWTFGRAEKWILSRISPQMNAFDRMMKRELTISRWKSG